MPKGKRKGKSDRSRYDGSLQTSDDDSNNNDAMSVISNYSKSSESSEFGEDCAADQLEDKLMEVMDGLSDKSSKTRIDSFKMLSKALIKKFIPNFVKDRLFTISDSIERSLKKGSGSEKAAAADLTTQLCIQTGLFDECEDICKNFTPTFLVIAKDTSVSPTVRGKCCQALGNMAFLGGGEMGEVLTLMQQLETIFLGSYLKGDGAVPNITPEVATMHAAALSAWTLLFTLMSPGNISHMMNNSKTLASLDNLSGLLESAHLEVRMAAGEALAVIFELGRLEDEEFEDDFANDIADTLKKLATDSNKYRAKKDRKQQRASFRDILQFIEENSSSNVTIKFGKEEVTLDSWAKRKQYEELCKVLGPGINIHLTENDLLRDIFEIIGVPPGDDGLTHAQQQHERKIKKIQNAANFKARTINRAKNRDKRCDF
ncbi:unnamed protein product [Brassicogethes aeneus]|uniref:Interferon-related developmental regulator 1 n=1 Tax=Brassicogethes aeneus TaxID=1431903 RepID=A0A9P0FHU6_BRAAE|nr:unnamed protein product [Brassicogethes aeneus]